MGDLKVFVVPNTSISVSSTASLELYFEWHRANRVNSDSNFFWIAVASCKRDEDVVLVVSEIVSHKDLMLFA